MKELKWKVYEKWLEPYENFNFYSLNGVLKALEDLDNPYLWVSNVIWNKYDNSFISADKIKPKIFLTSSVLTPKDDIYDYIKFRISDFYNEKINMLYEDDYNI
jgi:hypothetical protein